MYHFVFAANPLASFPLPIFTLFVLFAIWYSIKRSSNKRKEDAARDSFWERETKANLTRAVSLDEIRYVEIPLDTLPLGDSSDDVLIECEEELRTLSQERILNLTGLSNTDVKLKYGAANLAALTEYDNAFTQLCRVLDRMGQRLYELGRTEDAVCVLSYAVSIESDVSTTYATLANIYRADGREEELSALTRSAESLRSISRHAILRLLDGTPN
jgi:hypothetical protein